MSYPAATSTGRPRQRGLLPAEHGWTPYLWLVYVLIFLYEPTIRLRLGAMTVGHAAATLLALGVFLVSYFYGFRVKGRTDRQLGVVAVQTLLGVLLSPINAGSSVFFIYAASFAGTLDPPRLAKRTIVATAAAGALTAWVLALPYWFWIPAIGFPLVIGFANLQQAQADRANARLRLAQEQIEHLAAVAERERIARDLHDLLGHTLSLIVLKSELAAKFATRDAERAAREIRDVEQVARKALQEVREAIRGYRASLPAEVEHSRSLLDAAGIRATLEVEPVSLDRAAEEALALALREAVTNVVRHSHASHCLVRLHRNGDACTLLVEDDGRGADSHEGSGLRGMRERIEALGGTVARTRPATARGTRLAVRLPVPADTPA